ncbi:MAG TPA: hypothetical protein ENG69_00290 [Candidatus Korarchaeota archaeon]|mgnify:CR=1 FL=1|nr:hypothetical protein [Candidatus Korarchaeota archaeon]
MSEINSLEGWTRIVAEVLDEVDSAFIVYAPWPDSIASAALLKMALSEQGIGLSIRPALPEELLSVVEEAFAEDSVLILSDLLPTGSGPLQAAEQLWGQVLVVDHYDPERPRFPVRILRLNPLLSGLGPLPSSVISLAVARSLCPDMPQESWVALLGCLEPGAECPEGSRLVTSDRQARSLVERAYNLILEAIAGDPESGVLLGVAALEECFESIECFLSGSFPLSRTLLDLSKQGSVQLREFESQAHTLFQSQRLCILRVDDPRIRHVVAESASQTSEVAGAVYMDDVAAFMSLRSKQAGRDLMSYTSLAMLDLEGAFFGYREFVEISLRASQLSTLVRRLSELLSP